MQKQERQTKSNSSGNEIEEGGGRILQVSKKRKTKKDEQRLVNAD